MCRSRGVVGELAGQAADVSQDLHITDQTISERERRGTDVFESLTSRSNPEYLSLMGARV